MIPVRQPLAKMWCTTPIPLRNSILELILQEANIHEVVHTSLKGTRKYIRSDIRGEKNG